MSLGDKLSKTLLNIFEEEMGVELRESGSIMMDIREFTTRLSKAKDRATVEAFRQIEDDDHAETADFILEARRLIGEMFDDIMDEAFNFRKAEPDDCRREFIKSIKEAFEAEGCNVTIVGAGEEEFE